MDDFQQFPQMVYLDGDAEKWRIVPDEEGLKAALAEGYTEAPGVPAKKAKKD